MLTVVPPSMIIYNYLLLLSSLFAFLRVPSDSQVRVSAYDALRHISSLLDSESVLDTVIESHSSDGPRGTVIGSFDKFVGAFAPALMSKFPQRAEGYISSLQQLTTSDMPATQAESAVVLANFVVSAPAEAQGRVGLINVVRVIARLCESEEATVRCRAVFALGVLSGT